MNGKIKITILVLSWFVSFSVTQGKSAEEIDGKIGEQIRLVHKKINDGEIIPAEIKRASEDRVFKTYPVQNPVNRQAVRQFLCCLCIHRSGLHLRLLR